MFKQKGCIELPPFQAKTYAGYGDRKFFIGHAKN